MAYEINPLGATNLAVHSVEAHGPYLLVQLEGRREQVRFLALASEACAVLLRPEARVRYEKSGVFGRVSNGTLRCELAGVASLEAWRDRQPRRRAGLVPRSSARFTLVDRDDRVLLVRGRFAVASKIRIPAAYDLVALLPNDAPCRAALERGEGSIEFRPAGRQPFRLLVGDAVCAVEGFAIPPTDG